MDPRVCIFIFFFIVALICGIIKIFCGQKNKHQPEIKKGKTEIKPEPRRLICPECGNHTFKDTQDLYYVNGGLKRCGRAAGFRTTCCKCEANIEFTFC
jgi:hypothetical protein